MSSVQYFKEVATEWDNLANSFFGDSPREAIYEQVNWKNIHRVADLGCGAGYLTAGMIHRDVHVTALDQSQEMLDFMQSKFGNDKVSYVKADADSFPLKDDTFDLATANMFLHHVENPSQTISEAYRILKSGGKWIFTDLDEHTNEFLVTEQHDKWMGFKREDIKEWMESAGFKDVKIDCVGADCCASSCSDAPDAKVNIFIAMGTK